MRKKIISLLLILAITGCVIGVATKSAFIYVLSVMTLVTSILLTLLSLLINVAWKLISENFKKTYKLTKRRFDLIIFICIIIFYIIGGLLDELYLRGSSKSIRWAGIIAISAFAIFIIVSLIRRSSGKIIAIGSTVIILFGASLAFINSLRSGPAKADSSISKLGSLPYLNWSPAEKDIEKKGVTQYEPQLAFNGLNFYNSWVSPEVYLMDMEGNIVHKWIKQTAGSDSWKDHVELCKNGDLIVIAVDRMVYRLDWNSKIKWQTKIRAHHDVFIDEDKGLCYVLAREDAMAFYRGIPIPVLNDYIAVLSLNDGKIKKKVYLYELIKERVCPSRIVRLYTGIFRFKEIVKFFVHKIQANYVCQQSWHFDIMHTNSIEVMNKNIKGFCKKGDWLISIRDLDLVVVLDPKKEQLVWSWGPGQISRQHDASTLKNENVLIFDNGVDKGRSRVIELDPIAKKIVWQYGSKPGEKFYSRLSGGCQRLPNGNTLITESDKGRAFEVTKEGTIVWEFYNPIVKNNKRAVIYRMIRITKPEDYQLKL